MIDVRAAFGGDATAVWPTPGSEPVRETAEVAFIDSVERHDGCALYDLVFQGSDRERPLLPITALLHHINADTLRTALATGKGPAPSFNAGSKTAKLFDNLIQAKAGGNLFVDNTAGALL